MYIYVCVENNQKFTQWIFILQDIIAVNKCLKSNKEKNCTYFFFFT